MTTRRKGPAIKRARSATTKPNRSGTNLTDEQRAARGIGRITLRLPQDALDLLGAWAARTGRTRAELVEEMIRGQLDPKHEGRER